jgi:hypothetical protein
MTLAVLGAAGKVLITIVGWNCPKEPGGAASISDRSKWSVAGGTGGAAATGAGAAAGGAGGGGPWTVVGGSPGFHQVGGEPAVRDFSPVSFSSSLRFSGISFTTFPSQARGI